MRTIFKWNLNSSPKQLIKAKPKATWKLTNPTEEGRENELSAPIPPIRAYEKLLGLKGNPFKALSMISPEEATSLFVKQEGDGLLLAMVAETIAGSGSTFIALVGPKGIGRTHRLMVIEDAIEKAGGEALYFDVALASGQDILDRLIKAAMSLSMGIMARVKRKLLGFSETIPEEELEEIRTSPVKIGDIILEALVRHRPAAILLDGLHNAVDMEEYWRFIFFEAMRETVSSMPEGIIVAMAMSEETYEKIDRNFPALSSRLHHRFLIRPLTDEEALALVEKRVRAYQFSSSSQIPIDEEVVIKINQLVEGNPRRILRFLGKAVDLAVLLGRRRVDLDVLDSILRVDEPKFNYIKRSPDRFRDELFVIIDEFEGGPVELEALAEALETSPSEERTKLEAMVIAGLIEKDAAGRYYVPPDRFLPEKGEKEEIEAERRWRLKFRRRKV